MNLKRKNYLEEFIQDNINYIQKAIPIKDAIELTEEDLFDIYPVELEEYTGNDTNQLYYH